MVTNGLSDHAPPYERMVNLRQHRTATWFGIILAGLGLFAVVGGFIIPSERTLAFAFAGTFLFAAVLVFSLTTEKYIRVAVSESIYDDLGANQAALVREFDLQDVSVYIPRSSNDHLRDVSVFLFVPRHPDYILPNYEDLDTLFIDTGITRCQGISMHPAGRSLFDVFDSMLDGKLSDSPNNLTTQLADGLVDGLELTDSVIPEVKPGSDRATFDVTGGTFRPLDRFNNPIQSFFAVGLAIGLNQPIIAETKIAEDDRFDYTITCRWSTRDRCGDDRQIRSYTPAHQWPDSWSPASKISAKNE